ncbi:hypothetical protein ACFLXD_05560 [Chloroflexota bacterium]
MIKVGQRSKAKYWGNYSVKKVARPMKPVECHNSEQGVVFFEPTIVQLEWEKPPSEDKHEFWFPYWMTIEGKEKFGQYAPMIGEKTLLELFQDAIGQGFFSEKFLNGLRKAISDKLGG